MNKMLNDKIIELILSRHEDDYWDFKSEHHKNKAELLHDIICMANNRVDRDAYIIFGVTDKTYEVIGVENDQNRRNQQQMIDQLKNKKFIGGIRPKIELKVLTIKGHEIDVLIIRNSLDTPYFLVESYKDRDKTVRANHIYTRVGDTNTDIDKSADINHVEYLWRKRFGLHMTPFEKVQWLLQNKENWEEESDCHFNKQYPEFTLEFEEMELQESPEFYAYVMMNSSTYDTIIRIKYYATTLYSRQVVILDSGRYKTVVPEWGHLHFDDYHQDTMAFKYYIKTDISYLLHQYLLDADSHEAESAHNRLMEVVLLFCSEQEKDNFITYVNRKKAELFTLINCDDCCYSWVESNNELAHNKIVEGIKSGTALKKMLIEYRSLNM